VPAGRFALFGERTRSGHLQVAKPQGNYKHLGNKPVACDAFPRLSATRFVSLKTKGANPCHA